MPFGMTNIHTSSSLPNHLPKNICVCQNYKLTSGRSWQSNKSRDNPTSSSVFIFMHDPLTQFTEIRECFPDEDWHKIKGFYQGSPISNFERLNKIKMVLKGLLSDVGILGLLKLILD